MIHPVVLSNEDRNLLRFSGAVVRYSIDGKMVVDYCFHPSYNKDYWVSFTDNGAELISLDEMLERDRKFAEDAMKKMTV